MYILGLTGSIGMGKTTAAAMFRQCGVAVYDADAAVHQLMEPNGKALAPVKKLFPQIVENDNIDRKALGAVVFNNNTALASLESILHPLVQSMQREFLRQKAKSGESLVVLDIPLLFEKKIDLFCDAVAVVTAPLYLQKIRVLSRPRMTNKQFERILDKQLPNAEKINRAEFVIQTGIGRYHSLKYVRKIIGITRSRRGNCWPIQRVIVNA